MCTKVRTGDQLHAAACPYTNKVIATWAKVLHVEATLFMTSCYLPVQGHTADSGGARLLITAVAGPCYI